MVESITSKSYSLEYIDECLFFSATYVYILYRMLRIKKSALKILSLGFLFISATSLIAFFNILCYLTKFYEIDKIYLEKVGHLEGSHLLYSFDLIPFFNWCLSLSNTLKISSMFILSGFPIGIAYSLVRIPFSVYLDLFIDAPEKTLIFYRSMLYGTETYLALCLFLMKGYSSPVLNLCLFCEGIFRFYVNVLNVPVEIGRIAMHVIKKLGVITMVLSYMVLVEVGKKKEKKKTDKAGYNALEYTNNDIPNMIAFDDFANDKEFK